MKDAIRAWKDPNYRAELSAEELAALPANPAGESWPTMDTEELRGIVGGAVVVKPVSRADSCGYICTLTTECPILSFCCPKEL